MAENSAISWTDHTFNPWWGCSKISPGCANCYADSFALFCGYGGEKGTKEPIWGEKAGRRFFGDAHWNEPKEWNAKVGNRRICGRGVLEFVQHITTEKISATWISGPLVKQTVHMSAPQWEGLPIARPRVFCASMADWLEDREDLTPHLARLLALIHATPNLDWLVLSKRPEKWRGQITKVLDWLDKAREGIDWLNGTLTKRIGSLRSGQNRGVGNRLRRKNLASHETDLRPMDERDKDNAVQTGSRGNGERGRIPANPCNAERSKEIRGGPPFSVDSLQRPNSPRDDCKPQERDQVGQSSEPTGTGDIQRTAPPCDSSSRGGSCGREGREASENQFDGRAGQRNEEAEEGRGNGQGHRGGLRDEAESSQRDNHGQNLATRELRQWLQNWLDGIPPGNVWIGTTVENQTYAEKRIAELLKIPALIRFLSVEPQLGPVNLLDVLTYTTGHDYEKVNALTGHTVECSPGFRGMIATGGAPKEPRVHWVICGGESGPGRRPFAVEWAQAVAGQCNTAGVPFFMKQDAGHKSGLQGRIPDALWNRKEFPRINP
jgi:protein gp37